MSEFLFEVNESTQFRLLTVSSSLVKMLAHVSLVLMRMIKPLESGVRVLTSLSAAQPSFWIVGLAFLWDVVKLVWLATVIKRFVSVDTVVPVVIPGLVSTELSFVSIDIEYDWIDGL